MKQILYIVLLTVIVNGCSKNNVPNTTDNVSTLQGAWELRIEQGGMSMPLHYAPGTGNFITFHSNNYLSYKNGSQDKKGIFALVDDSTVTEKVCLQLPENEFTQRIVFDNDTTDRKVFFNVSNDTLTLLSGCFAIDAGSSKIYVKSNPVPID